MKVPIDRADLERLRGAVAERIGLQFDDARLELVAAAVGERLAHLGLDVDAYLARVASTAGRPELGELARRLTVGETYFFRNGNDLRALVELVLPDRARARAGARRLRILSAACSSGEEPYTLAMLARDIPALAGWDVSIHAFDVNPAAIERAVAARYSTWSLRQTPPEVEARHFRRDGSEYRLEDAIREMVSFEERNLLEDDPRFWASGTFDVVFCRNVLMYFAPETTRRVVARIAGSLAPGGYLFLGHAETLRGVSTEFHLRYTHGTFYYQLRDPSAPGEDALVAAAPPLVRAPPAAPAPAVALVPFAGGDAAWADAIGRASARIARLSEPAAAPAPAAQVAAPAEDGPTRVARAVELLREERFGEALAALGGAPTASESDEDVLLLRAVLLTSAGEGAAAEATCARILELDDLNAEAHYVMALCREHAGDRAGAASHDGYALYLDPAFAMPRLHLGLMAKRAGDLERARRELARALVLLAGESGSRILLLGGGFTRDALIDLCRAELRAGGGAA
ncbi:MAG: CheR family methyltransferase [Anaeromyxobacteraceae bacterium]